MGTTLLCVLLFIIAYLVRPFTEEVSKTIGKEVGERLVGRFTHRAPNKQLLGAAEPKKLTTSEETQLARVIIVLVIKSR